MKITGKQRSKNMRRHIRKAKQESVKKILSSVSKTIPEELKEAKTIAQTRNAITLLKLFGLTKKSTTEKSHQTRKIAKKILLHALPPKTSILASSMVLGMAVIGLCSSFGNWTETPLPNSLLHAQDNLASLIKINSDFKPLDLLTDAVGLLADKTKTNLSDLTVSINSLKTSWPQDNFTVVYNQTTFNQPSPETQTWATHIPKSENLNLSFADSKGKVLSANTTKLKIPVSTVIQKTFSTPTIKKQIEDVLNTYLAEGKFKGNKGDSGITSFVNNNNNNNNSTVNPIITYLPPVAVNDFTGSSFSGLNQLSVTSLIAINAAVNGGLTAAGSFNVQGNSTLATTTVVGNLTATKFIGDGSQLTGISSGGASQWSTATSTSNIFYNSGNVGIGTISPTQNFEVNGNAVIGTGITNIHYSTTTLSVVNSQASAIRTQLNIMNIGNTPTTGTAIDFYTYTNTGNTTSEARIGTIDDGNFSNHIIFSTKTPGNGGNNSLAERVRITSSGNVGINTSTPTTTFGLQGTSGADLFDLASSTGTSLLHVTQAGNVGIGTTTPAYKLDVAGSINASSPIFSSSGSVSAPGFSFNGSTNTGLYLVGSNNLRFSANGINSLILTDTQAAFPLSGSASSPTIEIGGSSNTGLYYPTTNTIGVTTAGTERLRVDSSGNVAIGVSSADAGGRLDIDGGNFLFHTDNAYDIGASVATRPRTGYFGTSIVLGNSGTLYGGTNLIEDRSGTNAQVFNIYNTYTDASNYERLGLGYSSNVITFNSQAAGTGTARNFSFSGGNIGVGTTTPSSALFVQGSGGFNLFTIASSTGTQLFNVLQNGNVGVGATSPTSRLTVMGASTASTTAFSTAGTGYSYVVPAGVTQITVRTWGAGGGAGQTNTNGGGAGGGGGFAQSTIFVTPGETLLIDVGGGGGGTTSTSGGSGGTNGGGNGVYSGSSGSTSGGGGGFSAIRRSSTYLVQAGGGGGGGNGMSSGNAGGAGGAGGGNTGNNGGNAGGSAGGAGGTSSAGGAGGGDPQNWCGSHSSGGAGSLNQGGNGLSVSFCNEEGGGGGGGHYGGGGGSMSFSGGGGGGGGGSDLVTGTNTVEITGSGTAAANTSDPYYVAGAGAGGTAGAPNGNTGAAGRVVITTVASSILQVVDSTSNPLASFMDNGNVGIGTTTPLATLAIQAGSNIIPFKISSSTGIGLLTLDVAGNLTTKGAMNANGSPDVSENVIISDPNISAGDVVMIDSAYNPTTTTNDNYNQFSVVKATSTKNVLGIISTSPGLLINANPNVPINSLIAPLTLAGRVPVKVSLENGSISPGDFLTVSANLAGYAAKATSSGIVIGQALVGFNSSDPNYTGTVLALVKTGYQVIEQPASANLWQHIFGSASNTLVSTLQSVVDKTVHMFDGAIYAAEGVFNRLFAREVHTDMLCVGQTCVTEQQFTQMVQASQQNSQINNTTTTPPTIIPQDPPPTASP